MKCHVAASLGLQFVPMTCLTLPMFLLGDSKNRSLRIPLGHQFLMNECLSPGTYKKCYFVVVNPNPRMFLPMIFREGEIEGVGEREKEKH